MGAAGCGVAVISLKFCQHGSFGISSVSVKLLPHTAAVLKIGIDWDHSPPVCPYPHADAVCNDISRNPGSSTGAHVAEQQDTSKGKSKQAVDAAALPDQQLLQRNRESLAASCDRTRMFVIWGPTPATESQGTNQPGSSHAQASNQDLLQPLECSTDDSSSSRHQAGIYAAGNGGDAVASPPIADIGHKQHDRRPDSLLHQPETDAGPFQAVRSTEWACLSGPHTAQQLQAVQFCCSTVACFDVLHQIVDGHSTDANETHDQSDASQEASPHSGQIQDREVQPLDAQTEQGNPASTHGNNTKGGWEQPCEIHDKQGHDMTSWVVSRWSIPVVGAVHLSAADDAVAVACADGMLLLLRQATGKLIRSGCTCAC